MGNVNHKKDANNNPVLIAVLGVLFAGFGGLAVYLGATQKMVSEDGTDSSKMLLLIGAVLAAVGVLFIVLSIIRGKAIKAYKALLADDGAYQTKATFLRKKLSSTTSSSVGVGRVNVPTSVHVFYKVFYSYKDETGVEHTVKSTMSYTREQAEHLESLQTFAIRCRGNVSAIVEEMPQTNSMFNI
jgi:hypothetical protein